MLAADLNAVIDGLFAGGATQVDIVDAHGSGNPEPDVKSGECDRSTNVPPLKLTNAARPLPSHALIA